MKTILILAVAFILFTQLTYHAAKSDTILMEKIIKIKCTEMSCNACKNSITKSINKLEGIRDLKIDLESKVITVTIEDTKTNPQAVLNAIIEAGYEAEMIGQ
jgi:mercuric ion binding protein